MLGAGEGGEVEVEVEVCAEDGQCVSQVEAAGVEILLTGGEEECGALQGLVQEGDIGPPPAAAAGAERVWRRLWMATLGWLEAAGAGSAAEEVSFSLR